MNDVTTDDAATALRILADAAVDRQNDLEMYSHTAEYSSSDDENDSPHPLFDAFYNQGGSSAIMSMTNFDVSEIEIIWSNFKGFIIRNYNNGRGRRSKYTAKDVFFMMLTVFKHGGQWDFLGKMFNIKGPTFERLIMNFIKLVWEYMYDVLVVHIGAHWTMGKMREDNAVFKNFVEARYATDVTFQQAFRPSGSMQEGKHYYSGKHKLYGYKVEVSVLPIGVAVNCSEHYPGSVSDLEIFKENLGFHKSAIKKVGDVKTLIDHGMLRSNFPKSWAILADKGYQGVAEFIRAIHPKKKPVHGCLTLNEERHNRSISSDRIIVENYFGRLCSLWTVMERKWNWGENHYDMIFKICLGLTNIHVKWHPLREEDLQKFQQIKNRNYHIGVEYENNRRLIQKRYREKRKRRMSLQFGSGLSKFPDRQESDEI